MANGEKVETRNHRAISCFDTPIVTFNRTPLVTLRKTSWRKAIQEWEWFMQGKAPCPYELASTWWDGQLGHSLHYCGGYGEQLREFHGRHGTFDQIEYVIEALKQHPTSRRILLTTWNPADCAEITKLNDNSSTPTPCHNTITQFYVRNYMLHAFTFQRSADLLLGLPHNWIQFWAFLVWLADETGLVAGTVQWKIGDAHIYDSPSHTKTAEEITSATNLDFSDAPRLVYVPGSIIDGEFRAEDFYMVGTIPDPITTAKPELFI